MTDELTIRPHHLLCAVCHAAGCTNVPAGDRRVTEIIKTVKSQPTIPMRLDVDTAIAQVHFLAVPDNDIARRQADYVNRFKDLETCRRLGIRPNTTYPAFEIAKLLFANIETLEGLCFWNEPASAKWPECRHARLDSINKMREPARGRGEDLLGRREFIFLPTRTKAEMRLVKEESAAAIARAERLFIRPHHLLCMMCVFGTQERDEPLEDDNLYELLIKMRDEPGIPVTLVEGCCDVCGPCPAYYAPASICFNSHIRDQFKDLRTFQKLGLAPGDTLPTRELMTLLYDRIASTEDICGPYMKCDYDSVWKACAPKSEGYEAARAKRLLA